MMRRSFRKEKINIHRVNCISFVVGWRESGRIKDFGSAGYYKSRGILQNNTPPENKSAQPK